MFNQHPSISQLLNHQVAKQYVSIEDFGTEAEIAADKALIKKTKRAYVNKKLGIQRTIGKGKANATFSMPKRQRVKSYQSLMQLVNMYEQTQDLPFSALQIEKNEEGTWPDPWLWPSCQLAPDRGPDMVCIMMFCIYCKHLNIGANWDMSHVLKCSTSKVLKAVKSWAFCVLYSTASNCIGGSTLSPCRLQQVRESVQSYMDTTSPEDDAQFMWLLPEFIIQMKLPIKVTDEGAAQKVWDIIRNHPLLYSKPQKVSLGKFQAIIYTQLRELPTFSLKGFFFSTACMLLGYLCNAILTQGFPWKNKSGVY